MKKTVLVKGIKFSYISVGEGTPCIMVHGNRDCKENFEEMANWLSKSIGGKYIMIDLRGHGESGRPLTGYNIPNMADDIIKIIEALGFEKINYIGHSLGSTIGIYLAAQYPDLISNLVLMSAAASFKIGFKRPEFSREGFRMQLLETNKRAAKYFFQDKYGEIQKRITDNWLKIDYDVHMQMIKLQHPNLNDEAQSIMCKTLLLYGTNDLSTTVEDGKLLNNLIKNSSLKIIDGGAHYMYLEIPEITNECIGEFLNEKAV